MSYTKLLGFAAASLLAAGSALAQTTTAPTTTTPGSPSTTTTREAPAGTARSVTPSADMAAFGRMKASDLIGKNVYAANGDRIGEIDDIVLNRNNKATAAVIGVGGFLGIGERKAAVPMNQLAMQGDRIVASTLTKEQLRDMGAYRDDNYERVDRNRTLGESR